MNGTSTLFPLSARYRGLRGFLIVAITLASASSALSMTDLYQLAQTSGKPMDMSKSTQIFGPYYGPTSSGQYSIGFTFLFDKQPYTTFSVSTNGYMTFGKNAQPVPNYSYVWPNYPSTSYMDYPAVAGYWLDQAGTNSMGKSIIS